MKRILFAFLFFTAFVSRAQTIDAGDTVIFDFSQASCIGNYFVVPVSFKSDDEVYAIDFSMKFDQAKITYDDIISYQPAVNASAFFNPGDSTLRFSSFSMAAIPHDTPIVGVRFIVSGYPVTEADFNTIHVYLNGDTCSYKFIPPLPPAVITPGGSLSVSPGDSVALSAPPGNDLTYLWSTSDTVQTIYVTVPGTYSVTVTTAGGCTSADSVMIQASTPLPVELIRFSAREANEGIYVEWSTASEINNDYFDVERSTDVSAWQTLSRIQGAGNTSAVHNYSTLDGMPEQGNNYYRLKQVDFDGVSGYSETIALNYFHSKERTLSVSVFQNPIDGLIYIFSSEHVTVQFFDLNGRCISQPQTVLPQCHLQIDTRQIPCGVYAVRVYDVNAQAIIKNIPVIISK